MKLTRCMRYLFSQIWPRMTTRGPFPILVWRSKRSLSNWQRETGLRACRYCAAEYRNPDVMDAASVCLTSFCSMPAKILHHRIGFCFTPLSVHCGTLKDIRDETMPCTYRIVRGFFIVHSQQTQNICITFIQRRTNVLVQHCINVLQIFCVYWVAP